MTTSEEHSPAVPADVRAAHGFDPAQSAGLFVGVSRFEDRLFSPVRYAVDDAVDLAHLFAFELRLMPPSKVVLGLAGDPRKTESGRRLQALRDAGSRIASARQTEVYAELDRQRRAAGEGGLFVAALATHGFSDQGGDFLVAADSLRRRIERTGVAVAELFDDVARSPSPRRLVLIDACRERLSADTRAGAEAQAAMSRSFAAAIAGASGQAVLAGATIGGYAYDDAERRNGVFTGAILDGLSGRAPVDERGFITVRTLADYVDRRVVDWVRDHRPDHAGVSQGIARRIEGAASLLPLAIDPVRRQAKEAWRARRAAALARLRENIGETIIGAVYDQVAAALGGDGSRPELEPLLEEIEALDGEVRSQRSFAFYFQHEFRPREHESSPRSGFVATPRYSAPSVPVGEKGRIEPGEASAATGVEAPRGAESEIWTDPILGRRFRLVPPGTFLMGSPRDEPERLSSEKQHRVSLSRGFLIAETAVTQGEWRKLMGTNPSSFKDGSDDRPVERVSWFDAAAFANALSERAGLTPCYELIGGNGKGPGEGLEFKSVRWGGPELTGYRLPTEAEWEYAARAGTKTPFSTGSNLTTDQANYDGNYPYADNPAGEYREKTVAVRSFDPNPWGLYEVHGNVYEWAWDWYGNYPQESVTDPVGAETGSARVVRGGGWVIIARICRSAIRNSGAPGRRISIVGFRVVRTAD